jgi:hypothetical protein
MKLHAWSMRHASPMQHGMWLLLSFKLFTPCSPRVYRDMLVEAASPVEEELVVFLASGPWAVHCVHLLHVLCFWRVHLLVLWSHSAERPQHHRHDSFP